MVGVEDLSPVFMKNIFLYDTVWSGKICDLLENTHPTEAGDGGSKFLRNFGKL
jgi:hypothetical protein